MINGQTVMGVIPARAGSKRAPGKNLRPFRGRPLIAWAADAARGSKYLDTVILSTDCHDILALGKTLKLPSVLRPRYLAEDHAMNEGVMLHLLYTRGIPDWLVLLQPTSPLRVGADIDACLTLAQQGNGCVSVREDGTRNGAVYVVRAKWFMATLRLDDSITYQMPDARSLDIDYPEQFE